MKKDFIKPKFWKLSQSPRSNFTFKDIMDCINEKVVYISANTLGVGGAKITQAEDFVSANIGDYFYLTHGNNGIYLIGQFVGKANYFHRFSSDNDTWIERPFKIIQFATHLKEYNGTRHGWTPNQNSTFVQIPENEFDIFEQEILIPYFNLNLNFLK